MKFIELLQFYSCWIIFIFVLVVRGAISTTEKTGFTQIILFIREYQTDFQIEQSLPNKYPMSRSLFRHCTRKGKLWY